MADVNIQDLSGPQQESLEQYIQVTNQEPKDAIPLLERSQWNVQVRPCIPPTASRRDRNEADVKRADCCCQIFRRRRTRPHRRGHGTRCASSISPS